MHRAANMAPEELRDVLRHSPFEPFRIVMTDGAAYDIRHPDLFWIGRRIAMVGLTGHPADVLRALSFGWICCTSSALNRWKDNPQLRQTALLEMR